MTELDRIIGDEVALETSEKEAEEILDSAADLLVRTIGDEDVHSAFMKLNLMLSVDAANENFSGALTKISSLREEWKSLCLAMMLTGSTIVFNHMIQREAMKRKLAGEAGE